MRKMKDEIYCCRVCGLEHEIPPWGEDGQTPIFEICGCCGVTFGYQDITLEYVKRFREEWLKKGGGWTNPKERPPDWMLEEELRSDV